MADIAFLLLIFFLVSTTVLQESGLPVRLPPWTETPPPKIPDRNILSVKLNAQGDLLVEGERASIAQLAGRVKAFITNPQQLSSMPAKPARAVISLQHDRGTTYGAYVAVYDQLQKAYRELWDSAAQQKYGRPMQQLSREAQLAVKRRFPMVISEAEPTDF